MQDGGDVDAGTYGNGGTPLEMWGGLECSVVRRRGGTVDQTRQSGHDGRPEDLDAFAALGIRAIRYPVLWERVAPKGLDRIDWRWADERLGRLRALDVRPIAALLHHGHGPRGIDLLHPEFPERFAAYAGTVAERYPWLDAYTPVNEPLTTARFCGLYGVWHPHKRSRGVFSRLLVNQIRGTVLAMQAIRRVNPAARLVQTEDLGRCHSTPRLAYQAAHENERRWLTFDLLCGRVGRDHPLWRYLTDGEPEVARALDEIADQPCPPDVLGIDHYLTSERYLDERLDRYPGVRPAGNGRHRYVDVEAIRVLAGGPVGIEALMEEAWQRYRLPLAMTEVHNGSSREEQLRWLKEAWEAALALRSRGVDCRAVTAWALLGLYDWNSLLTRSDGFYETGVFDVRGPRPRPTALARLVRGLATDGAADHPVLDAPGWWRREDRFSWAPVRPDPAPSRAATWTVPGRRDPRPLLIVGGGTLAGAVARLCVVRGLPHVRLDRRELDAADPAAVAAALARLRPWAVVNGAGCARVDRAETQPEPCRRANLLAAAVLADAAAGAELPFLTLSSHLVFDGRSAAPYDESAATAPLGVYGAVKRQAEETVLRLHPAALVVRSGPLFGPWDRRNACARAIRAAETGSATTAAADVTVSPTYLPDLVNVALDLLIDGEGGLWHLATPGAVTWADFLAEAVRGAGLDASAVRPAPAAEIGWTAPRPAFSALASVRGAGLPGLENALGRFLADRHGEPDLTDYLLPEPAAA